MTSATSRSGTREKLASTLRTLPRELCAEIEVRPFRLAGDETRKLVTIVRAPAPGLPRDFVAAGRPDHDGKSGAHPLIGPTP